MVSQLVDAPTPQLPMVCCGTLTLFIPPFYNQIERFRQVVDDSENKTCFFFLVTSILLTGLSVLSLFHSLSLCLSVSLSLKNAQRPYLTFFFFFFFFFFSFFFSKWKKLLILLNAAFKKKSNFDCNHLTLTLDYRMKALEEIVSFSYTPE